MTLQEPHIIDRDPAVIEAEMVAAYEAATGKVLYPAQIERLLIHTFAYRETLARVAFRDAALQNFLAWARYPMIDYLGQLVGVSRIPAVAATGSVTMTGINLPESGLPILPGFKVAPAGGRIVFETTAGVVLTDESPTVTVPVKAVEAGEVGNGFVAGSSWEFVDGLPELDTVVCASTTTGGVDEESDDHLREEIRLAPQSWATGGTSAAYRWHAKRVSTMVLDANPVSWVEDASLMPGTVMIWILTEPQLLGTSEGDAQAESLCALVHDTLTSPDIRALNDTLLVSLVTVHQVSVSVSVSYYSGAAVEEIEAGVIAAFNSFNTSLQRQIGKDLVASQLMAALMSVSGVYAVDVLFQGGAPPVIDRVGVYAMTLTGVTYTRVEEPL